MMRFVLILIWLILQPLAQAAECELLSHVCIEGPSTKTISGYQVTRECWQYKDTYKCSATDFKSNCQELVDKGCGQIGSKCIEENTSGTCALFEDTYQCKIQEGQSRTVKDCGTQTFCTDGNCFDASHPNDKDITQVISGMEALREAGVYFNENSATVFNGTPEFCERKLGGLFNCCGKKVQAGPTNNSWMTSVGYSVGSETIRYIGSNYMYDALFAVDAPSYLFQAASGIVPLDASLDFAPSVFGVTLGYSSGLAPASALTSWGAGSGQMFISFDPYSFAFAVGMMLLQEMMACDEKEMRLSVKRASSLCARVGSYCDKKALGSCLIKKESYCCYNSKIAKIINISGRAQLGMGFGAAKAPNCRGFTLEQLQSLDLSAMDFSELTADIQNKMRSVGSNYASDRAANKVPESSTNSLQPYKSQNYFSQ